MCQELTEFNKTSFITVPITTTLVSGIPIGEGRCKAVRLRINAYQRNSSTGLSLQLPAVYYGDAQSQENELVGGITIQVGTSDPITYQSEWTPKIYCQNLEEVFIRSAHVGVTVYVQVMILSNE